MQIPILNDILILFGIAIAVILLCHRLHIPTIVGLLITGAVAGPHGLGLIAEIAQVELLAEIGIILLLFTIGMNLSFESVLQMKKSALLGGSVQIGLSILAGYLLSAAIGMPFGQAIFIGFLISHSSTTIMLKIFQQRSEVDSPHGRTSLAISISQDIMTVPMMLLTPVLAVGMVADSLDQVSPLWILLKGLGILALAIFVGKYLIPPLFFQIAKTRSRELFLLSLIAICFGIAGLTYSAGLSLALGAFLAGLMVSESQYAQQAIGDMSTFRDVFTSFFFISIGMLLNLTFLFGNPLLILTIALIVLIIKAGIASFAAALLGYPPRTVILTGLALCNVGEFSFVLSRTGVETGLMDAAIYQTFLAVTVMTLAAAPFIITFGPKIADIITRIPAIRRREQPDVTMESHLQDHLVIVGFGINGRNLARAARVAGIPYVILEMNPETVKQEKKKGEPIYYGDGTQKSVLEHIGVKKARVAVIAVSDPLATRGITKIVRDMNPAAYIITRTRFFKEVKPLLRLGGNEVIPEEFETSIEIFARVLQKYLTPKDKIEKFIQEVRSDSYQMLRSLSVPSASFADLKMNLPDIEITTIRLAPKAHAVGKTLAQIDLRKRYGLSLVAIRRDSQVLANPAGDTILCAEDALILLGKPDKISDASELFQ